jgi:hypothetical protein
MLLAYRENPSFCAVCQRLGEAQLLQRLQERPEAGLSFGIVRGQRAKTIRLSAAPSANPPLPYGEKPPG